MKKTIIINKDEETGEITIDVLKDGYNIIEKTIYDGEELVQPLLNYLEGENHNA